MANKTDTYQSPFQERYGSEKMRKLFSPDYKFSTWRKLWLALARAEQKLGLDITDEQIEELKSHIYDINYDVAKEREKIVRHDVMSHVYAYGQQCPKAAPIIHLGATSCYVTDNTDILIIDEALEIIKGRLTGVIKLLADFAKKYRNLPTLGLTHLQPAALTTVGKRATLWLQNFKESYEMLDFVQSNLKMLGCRGATGSSETFMKLFDGDEEKVKKLDELIMSEFSFFEVYPVSGQTYPRNLDLRVMNALSEIAASAHKMGDDIRILQSKKEIEEPFEKSQIGSSAMAYKRNPMRDERMCSLAKSLVGYSVTTFNTASTQWMERTLDDSANRRFVLPEAFLIVDQILILASNIVDGLVVYTNTIDKNVETELPFMITEEILMEAVKKGGNRQKLHEKIRKYSMEVKMNGTPELLPEKISNDLDFGLSWEEILGIINQVYPGRCGSQVEEYLYNYIYPFLNANKEMWRNIDSKVEV